MNTRRFPSVTCRRAGRGAMVALGLIAIAPTYGRAQTRSEDQPSATQEQTKARTRMVVESNNWLDVHLYLVRDGLVTSLGVMNGPGTSEFTVPRTAMIPGSGVQILVLPIGSTDTYLSPVTVIAPGDVVNLVVENNLALSHVVVSPAG